MSREEMNTVQQYIYSTIRLLAEDREQLRLSLDQLRIICRQDPKFALETIGQFRTHLFFLESGKCAKEISRIVRTVEWELMMPTGAIERGRIFENAADKEFLLFRLVENPHEFGLHDIERLMEHFGPSTGVLHRRIKEALLDITAKQAISFAERVATGPINIRDIARTCG